MQKTIKNVLTCPVWVLQLFTGAKSFRDNPLIGSRRLNEAGLHGLRQGLAHWAAGWRRRRLRRAIPPHLAAEFDRDGFVVIRDFLPAATFGQVLDDVRRYRGAGRETIQGDTVTRRIALTPDSLDRMPGVRRLLDGTLLGRLIRLAGSRDCEPLYYIQTILPHAVTGEGDPQLQLHADTFHPTVKAWFTLTDTAEGSGPFVYVPGSHKLNPARQAWEKRMSLAAGPSGDRLSGRGSFRVDEAAIAGMGYPPPRAVAVPANSLIVADTGGFHARGVSADPGIRVEIWAYERGNPFFAPLIDIWRIPALGRRRGAFVWALHDWLEASGFGVHVWRKRSDVGAFDGEVAGHGAVGIPPGLSTRFGQVTSRMIRRFARR
ncbi:phytanoyl-CoA dioxygenase family protein [Gluconacetobacter sacchari]|uniref:Phytanoyl-CoA dioxygenase n=2 Tax=Gluconacetobacter sacchari TaxID=92759 RepID=A0A7W4IC52_9PROT|nr:phytanoyl-CoA dioxygenase family protein [Gluconacetobacter sacchari]MBB2160130.1 phytanoyl-CoA dioxygenase [Gluconacetobacter sacchari]GBQ25291.1 phytanoyl-CoA dioxygenase [Gluconacetobacter sacchari DSM 12717]